MRDRIDGLEVFKPIEVLTFKDDGLKAPRARTAEQWLAHPNRFDIPNVDTPKRKDK
jgi:hypothetical protein